MDVTRFLVQKGHDLGAMCVFSFTNEGRVLMTAEGGCVNPTGSCLKETPIPGTHGYGAPVKSGGHGHVLSPE